MTTGGNINWTAEEDAILTRHGSTLSYHEVAELLPNRSYNAVKKRHYRMVNDQISDRASNRTIWTEAEKKRLRSAREDGMSFAQIVEKHLPGRTASAAHYHYEAMTRGRLSTYSVTDPAIGETSDERAFKKMAAFGSRQLLEAYMRYFAKHVVRIAA